jgi:L-ascorbate metabolism protein UlaG (beta-lactamase superfamily)
MADVLAGVELVTVSHLHRDHFDEGARRELPKDLPLLCQPGDQASIEESGFTAVREIEETVDWHGIRITRTSGTHTLGTWAERLNPVSGFVFQADGEPTLYWIGDSVWCDDVSEAIARFEPDVIVTHSGGAQLGDSGLILMDATQTLQVAAAAPAAVLVVAHMEAQDHCRVSRADLQAAVTAAGVSERVFILADGEEIVIE